VGAVSKNQEPLVFFGHNRWWYLDETFKHDNCRGPFDTEEEAATACIAYFERLTGMKIHHFLRD
jgi:hypothetical protein